MQFDKITDEFSIRTGAVRLHDLGYLIAGDNELDEMEYDHSLVFEWDPNASGWGGYKLDWTATTACVCEYPKEQLVVVGQYGEYLVFGQGDNYEGVIPAKSTASGEAAPFRGVNSIAGKAYAVGMNSQVFRRDGRTDWASLDQGLAPEIRLEAIDGFAPDALYAVGWKGALWYYNGSHWLPIDSPTNEILTGVCCAGDGQVYACGRNAVILKGSGGQWEVLDHGITEEDFWDMEWFEGKLYLSTTRFVYNLIGQKLQLVKFGKDSPKTCYHLSARDGVLWSVGQKDVLSFDRTKWLRIT